MMVGRGGCPRNCGSDPWLTEAAREKHPQPVMAMKLCGEDGQQWNTPAA
jgi:hypothetical protein